MNNNKKKPSRRERLGAHKYKLANRPALLNIVEINVDENLGKEDEVYINKLPRPGIIYSPPISPGVLYSPPIDGNLEELEQRFLEEISDDEEEDEVSFEEENLEGEEEEKDEDELSFEEGKLKGEEEEEEEEELQSASVKNSQAPEAGKQQTQTTSNKETHREDFKLKEKKNLKEQFSRLFSKHDSPQNNQRIEEEKFIKAQHDMK